MLYALFPFIYPLCRLLLHGTPSGCLASQGCQDHSTHSAPPHMLSSLQSSLLCPSMQGTSQSGREDRHSFLPESKLIDAVDLVDPITGLPSFTNSSIIEVW